MAMALCYIGNAQQLQNPRPPLEFILPFTTTAEHDDNFRVLICQSKAALLFFFYGSHNVPCDKVCSCTKAVHNNYNRTKHEETIFLSGPSKDALMLSTKNQAKHGNGPLLHGQHTTSAERKDTITNDFALHNNCRTR